MSLFDWCRPGSVEHAKCRGSFERSYTEKNKVVLTGEWILCECTRCKHTLPEGAKKERKKPKRKIVDVDLPEDDNGSE